MKKIMIIVPHEDDEILMTAGIIRRAVKEENQVTVVMATNGDYEGCDKVSGSVRLPETTAGLRVLGLSDENVIFMGYADTGMDEKESFLYCLYTEKDENKVLEGHCSNETYALPYKVDFHTGRYGAPAMYTRKNFKADLRDIIITGMPDEIYTTSEEDMHGDHSGLYLFVKEILEEEFKHGYRPVLYSGVVHSKAGDAVWPVREEMPGVYSCPEGFDKGTLAWADRVVFPVPEEMLSADFEKNLKACALSEHKNALKEDAVEFLYAFMKAEEVFWKITIGAIYPIEPWTITETEFLKETNYRNETTFALSNGYLGTRGTLEEGYPFTEEEGMEGNFINGFYESEQIRYGEWNFGFPDTSQSLLNLPNLKTTQIYLEDEKLNLLEGDILQYARKLHMQQGYVSREVIWKSPKGKEVKIYTERFCSLDCKNLMVQRMEITPLNFEGEIRVSSVLEGNVINHTRTTNPLVDYGPFGPHLLCDSLEADEEKQSLFYEGTTKNSKLSMACIAKHDWEASTCTKTETIADTDAVTARYEMQFAGEKDVRIVLNKYIAYTSCLDMPAGEMHQFLEQVVGEASKEGAETLKRKQVQCMKEFWENADIRVDGDDALQQGIRFNLFHIMQAAGRDGKTGMGAKGLSGEGYEGHYFWDTEMYVLPVFVYTNPQLAKSLLDYRYHTLDEARQRARVLGHEKGALYPWRTINGKEASTYFPLGTAQYHINADIAYAFKLYMDVNGDDVYLLEKGAEVLIETARVWADVGSFAECKGGKYCICAVTGPDEYNAIVDNNFYTNLMARENLRDALWALEKVKAQSEEAYRELATRLSLEKDEPALWKKIIENMYFPYDEKRQVYPLDDGFMMRKPWDDSKIPEEKRHLLYENYHPLFVYRQRMSKQADAILGMLLHSNYFTDEELRRNYDFYQEVTLHHSSLSTCIFGILASQIGYQEEAYTYFSQSARMDLDDYHNNFYAGIHAANMAGTWQGIVFGFAGVRTNRNRLEFKPSIPKQWKQYEFCIQYQGSRLRVQTTQQTIRYILLNEAPVSLYLGEEKIHLEQKGDYYEKEL